MKKNSCTPINPKKYSCNGLNKIHAKNLITKKNSCSSKIPLPPRNFSNGPSLTFSYRNFFRYLFVLTYFDSSRRHTNATTHATGTQIVRAKMTSLDAIFCWGNKSSSCSLARFCRRKHKNSTDHASRSWKIWARLAGKSTILQMLCCA